LQRQPSIWQFMMVKKDKTKEKAKRPFHKGGMPPFVPTEVDRAIVQLLVSMGMAQHRVCLRIRGRDGKPIAETTLKKHFAHELMVGKVEVVTKVLTKFMQAIEEDKRASAIVKHSILMVMLPRKPVASGAGGVFSGRMISWDGL
jgi:hypothetical protein